MEVELLLAVVVALLLLVVAAGVILPPRGRRRHHRRARCTPHQIQMRTRCFATSSTLFLLRTANSSPLLSLLMLLLLLILLLCCCGATAPTTITSTSRPALTLAAAPSSMRPRRAFQLLPRAATSNQQQPSSVKGAEGLRPLGSATTMGSRIPIPSTLAWMGSVTPTRLMTMAKRCCRI